MAFFECIYGSGGSSGGGSGVSLIVTCDNEFAGSTITCTNGTLVFTQTCPSISPYVVEFQGVPSGTWILSGTASGDSYSKQVIIEDISVNFNAVPDGKIKVPTDDIQIWLKCASITDKSYTTIAAVLDDTATLLALINNNNACDYMARSTTWVSSVCANQTAMTDIGNSNYCADTLLGNSDWLTGITSSNYMERILNVKIPIMTSNTSPSGSVTASSVYPGRQAYYAFNGSTPSTADAGTFWCSASQNIANQWLQYEFDDSMKVKYFVCYITGAQTWTAQATVDGSWIDLGNVSNSLNDNVFYKKTGIVVNDIEAKKFRFTNKSTIAGYAALGAVQFYGRRDV